MHGNSKKIIDDKLSPCQPCISGDLATCNFTVTRKKVFLGWPSKISCNLLYSEMHDRHDASRGEDYDSIYEGEEIEKGETPLATVSWKRLRF